MEKEKFNKGIDLMAEFGKKLDAEGFSMEEASIIFLEGYNAAIRVNPKLSFDVHNTG